MNNETYNLIEDFPEFADLINSKQFEYAQKLIQIRLSSGLGFKEMADIVGYTPEEYLSFEHGEQNINIEEYEVVIRKLEMHINPEEIEEEKRYYVLFGNQFHDDNWTYALTNSGSIEIFEKDVLSEWDMIKLTEQEIKDYDPRCWIFRKPVEGVEENDEN